MIYCKKINLVHENYIIKSILRQSATNYGWINCSWCGEFLFVSRNAIIYRINIEMQWKSQPHCYTRFSIELFEFSYQ